MPPILLPWRAVNATPFPEWRPMRQFACAFILCYTLPCWGADRIHLTVTAVSHDSRVSESTSVVNTPTQSNTSCIGTGLNTGPMSTANVNCQTMTQGGPQTVTNRRLDVEDIVEANGEWFTISCTGYWALSNCSPMRDGDKFEAEYDGKQTMWIAARRGGNLGKPITVKYRVLDRRPAATAAAVLGSMATVNAQPEKATNGTQDRRGVVPAPEVASLPKADASGAAIPKGITVRFTSAPSGAEVNVDGYYWGTTPTADLTKLPAGSHAIVVKKLGYHPWESQIELAIGDDRTINAELEVDSSKPRISGLN